MQQTICYTASDVKRVRCNIFPTDGVDGGAPSLLELKPRCSHGRRKRHFPAQQVPRCRAQPSDSSVWTRRDRNWRGMRLIINAVSPPRSGSYQEASRSLRRTACTPLVSSPQSASLPATRRDILSESRSYQESGEGIARTAIPGAAPTNPRLARRAGLRRHLASRLSGTFPGSSGMLGFAVYQYTPGGRMERCHWPARHQP